MAALIGCCFLLVYQYATTQVYLTQAIASRVPWKPLRGGGFLMTEYQADNLLDRRIPQTHEEWELVYDALESVSSREEFFGRLRAKGFVAGLEGVPLPEHIQRGNGALPSGAEATTDPTAEPRSAPQLTRELAWKYSRDNVVLVTWTNYFFIDFAENWASYLRGHGIENYLVGAMDRDTAVELTRRGVHVFAMFPEGEEHSGLGADNFDWGGASFHKMGRQKITLLQTFLSFGLDVLLCDSDTVWIKDPTDYFNSLPQADILTSTDHMYSTVPEGDAGLELPELASHSAMNIGAMFFRHGAHTKALVAEWVARIEANDKLWDQDAFNQIVRSDWQPLQTVPENPRLFWGFNHTVVVGVLNVASFANGHTYFVQRLAEVRRVPEFMVHTTFQYGGPEGKRTRLRHRGLWSDPPEYYAPPGGGFISMDLLLPPVPDDFPALDTAGMIAAHLAHMESQLLQVKAGLALALMLNRTIIMPQMLCYCDKYWAPVEKCRMPGATQTTLPFVCPLDHVFEPFNFDDKPEQFGPAIKYREHAFLTHSECPDAVRGSKVDITAAAEGVTPPGQQQVDLGGTLVLPGQQASQKVLDALGGHPELASVWIWHFTNPTALFNGQWTSGGVDAERRFMERLGHMSTFWCCRQVDSPTGVGKLAPHFTMLRGLGVGWQ